MSKINTVAIIGGGVSGLSAGGLLVRQGLRVKLFEANDKLGGSCANTIIDGYTFHDGALYLAFPGILEHVFMRLGLDRASLLPLRKITANQTTTLPDGTVVSIGNGCEVTIQRQAAVNQDQLEKEIDHMLKKWEPVRRLFAEDLLLHPLSLSQVITKGWRHLPKLRGTVASEIKNLFSDEAVRAAISGVTLYAGKSPQQNPVQSLLGAVAMMTEGFYLPVGGMGKIPEALSQALKNNGGEIFLNSKIERIVLRNGRVQGLQVAGQGLAEADAVISTVSGMLTYSLLADRDVPGVMRRKAQTVPLSHKALVVQLGLSNRIDAPSHSNNVLPMIDEQYQVFGPDEDEMKWLNYLVPTVTMPELASKGGSIIEVFPSIKQNMSADYWNEGKKEQVATQVTKALARLYGHLDIAVKRVTSPKDFQNRMHLYQGAVYGLSPTADLGAYFSHATPIPGLFQAGQTTFPGYGVSSAAMSGVLAAEKLMQKEE